MTYSSANRAFLIGCLIVVLASCAGFSSVLGSELEGNGLQEAFLEAFTGPKIQVDHNIVVSQLPNVFQEQYNALLQLVPSGKPFMKMHHEHQKAFYMLLEIFEASGSITELLATANLIRDDPQMNYKLWLASFITASLHQKELVGLKRPHLLWLMPDSFINANAIQEHRRQLLLSNKDQRVCIPLDGSIGEDNGVENAIWYFREDLLVNAQHIFWHLVHSNKLGTINETITVDRNGELFYYFHRNVLARYDAERLSNGLRRVKPLIFAEGAIVNPGFNPHMIDLPSEYPFAPRPNDTYFTNIHYNVGIADQIISDIDSRAVIWENGTVVSLDNISGTDILADLVEASIKNINKERYGPFGVHNEGHGYLALLSSAAGEEQWGVMAVPNVAMRDPIFYRWHKYVDDWFYRHQSLLTPHHPTEGELPLLWSGVSVDEVVINTPGVENVLRTHFGQLFVELPLKTDITPSNETLEYCITRLEHQDFQYNITITRQPFVSQSKGTVRIFMAPRFNETGGRFLLEEQNQLYFAMDAFTIDLEVGRNTITRNSSDSSLLLQWKLENWTVSPPSEDSPNCGCGWPSHLLVPKGSATGMEFDLFVMVTDAGVDDPNGYSQQQEPECNMGQIICGIQDQKYPDIRPMGYPFDRKPFSISTPEGGSRMVSDLEEYVSFIPNSNKATVTIIHDE